MEEPPRSPVFISTNLHTHLALDFGCFDTISHLKASLKLAHSSRFPSYGEIHVNAIKIKHRGCFYFLSDSFMVRTILIGARKGPQLYADVSISEDGHGKLGADKDTNLEEDNINRNGDMCGEKLNCPEGHGALNTGDDSLQETDVEELPKNASVPPQPVDVGDESLPRKRKKCASRKDSTEKQHPKGTKHVSDAPNSLPEVEDRIDNEKIIGDTTIIMDEEAGAGTGDISQDKMVAGDSKNATREDVIQGLPICCSEIGTISSMNEIESVHIVVELGNKYPTFDLKKVVCNHGMFMMAPNRWIPETSTFQRPLRLADGATSVDVSISQHDCPTSRRLIIRIHDPHPQISSRDHHIIQEQVCRMLRISERDERMMNKFHEIHLLAKQEGFGRIFHNPTIFEDAVKIFLFCYSDWERTMKMAKVLCVMQRKIATGEYKNRHNRKPEGSIGNFPNAEEIITLGENGLREYCKVGHRAQWILTLAKKFVSGENRDVLSMLEQRALKEDYDHLKPIKKSIKGMGDFAFNLLLMCVGVYDQIPGDTETVRHFRMVHKKEDCTSKNVKKYSKILYEKYHPFESLAYWYDQVSEYERSFGKLSQLSPEKYHLVTGKSRLMDSLV